MLHIFICSNVTNYYPFISACRTPSGISYKAGLVVNFLMFFISLHF